MSRTIPIAIDTSIDTGTSRLAFGIRIVRPDGVSFSLTTASRSKFIDTDTTFDPGLDVQSVVQSAGFGVDNTEITLVPDDEQVTRLDILAGRWDASAVTLSVFDWKNPGNGEIVFLTGTIGDIRPRNGAFVAELRDLRQALQQDTTDTVQSDCRYRLGDSKCTIDLNDSDGLFTVTGTVTSVASRRQFTDTARTEVADYFGLGEVRFTSGLNSGLRFLVRDYASDVFTLANDAPFAITIGDAYTAIVGCRKRAFEDCRDKFDNIINFGGEPDKARVDFILRGV